MGFCNLFNEKLYGAVNKESSENFQVDNNDGDILKSRFLNVPGMLGRAVSKANDQPIDQLFFGNHLGQIDYAMI